MATTSIQDTATFTVRLVPTDPRNLKTFATTNPAREEFWRSTAQIDPDKVDLDIDLCETRFLQTFATRFRDTITARVRTREGTLQERGTKSQQLNLPGANRFRLIIESHEYGSLEAKILVEGATTIASAFSGRMDLFTAFVEQYTPQVFVAGLPIDPVSEHPVSAEILAADGLANNQFKAVRDELAKRKSASSSGSAPVQNTVQAPTAPPPAATRQSSAKPPSNLSAVTAGSPAAGVQPVAAPNTLRTSTVVANPDGRQTSIETLAAATTSEQTAQQATAAGPSATLNNVETTETHHDVKMHDEKQQSTPQIIMVPQPYLNSPPIAIPEQSHRNNRLWVVANLSLLFPVLLALVVLYFTYSGLQAERALLAVRQADIEKREKEIQQLMLARERQLFEALHPSREKSSPGAGSVPQVRAP